MKRVICYLRDLFFGCDIRPAQFGIGVASVLWALMLFWPGDTFERQTYAVMAIIAPESVWAAAFFFVGFVSLYQVCGAVYHQLPAWFSKFDSLVACVVWTSSVISILIAQSPPPAAIAGEITLAFASWWVFVRSDLPVYLHRRQTDV